MRKPSLRSDRALGLRRRDFLALGAAGAASAWFVRPLLAAAEAPDAVAQERLSVGYLAGSETWEPLRDVLRRPGVLRPRSRAAEAAGEPEERLRVVPADSLPMGDRAFAGRGVRVAILGVYPGVPAALGRRLDSARLRALFPSDDPSGPRWLPFEAWSLSRRPSVETGARLSFVMPIDDDGGLDLLLETRSGLSSLAAAVLRNVRGLPGGAPPEGMRRALQTRFTLDWTVSQPRLQRGVYLLGFAPDTWARDETLPLSTERPRIDLCSLVMSVDAA